MVRKTQFQVAGILWIAFCVIAFLCASLTLPGMAVPDLKGRETAGFETGLSKNSVFYPAALRLWADFDYAAFHEGRKGVVVGDGGWLYSAEEFETPRDAGGIYNRHVAYINAAAALLARNDIKLYIALIPSKARLHARQFPRAKELVLANFMRDVKAPVINLAPALGGDGFLKTDTHWSPEGARRSALMISHVIGRSAGETLYSNKQGDLQVRPGDLLKYIPLSKALAGDEMIQYEFQPLQNGDLFGDKPVEFVLVGTSYSARKEFNFDHFLMEYLNRDVLNMADAGVGPFVVMKNYLTSESYRRTKPKIVLWEIPERYLTMDGE